MKAVQINTKSSTSTFYLRNYTNHKKVALCIKIYIYLLTLLWVLVVCFFEMVSLYFVGQAGLELGNKPVSAS